MGEYAYDFTGENVHDGPARNPHDVTRMTGGSSGGSSGAVAGGYFKKAAFPESRVAVERVAAALGANADIEIPDAARARAAAYVITASEGAALHLERLRAHAHDYDPAVRDRLIAGAMIPAALVVRAQKFRRWYRAQVLPLLDRVDAILAPATPCTAPAIGQQTFVLDGVEMPVRPNLGLYTQPISFIGLPVVAVPVPLAPMPIGVQIIAAPWREDIGLRIAYALEQAGVCVAPRPAM
jgi:aspartyl-tRNA(Asn)/glutamyl-tRNA(Gln) amidotransferase subunit A